MVTSSDSLLPSPPDRTEAEARIAAALTEARHTLAAFDGRLYVNGHAYRDSLARVVSILDGGQS